MNGSKSEGDRESLFYGIILAEFYFNRSIDWQQKLKVCSLLSVAQFIHKNLVFMFFLCFTSLNLFYRCTKTVHKPK